MILSFRWYGPEDIITLRQISQIPGVQGIVTALSHNVPVGQVWPFEQIMTLKQRVAQYGFQISVIESVPVHEDIKLGKPTRDEYITYLNQTLRHISRVGIKTVCYNFMPVFDWIRSDLHFPLADGSTALRYDQCAMERINPVNHKMKLPGWETSYQQNELDLLLEQYQHLTEEQLWRNLEYFIRAVAPVAEQEGIKLAIHPDDPPWPVFGLPRIVTNRESLERIIDIYDSPSNGLCLCSGSLGADPNNDVIQIATEFGQRNRINFVHARNIRRTGERTFHETAHLSSRGDIDMFQLLKVLSEIRYEGPLRPDHGRMIWDEEGKPGYGLFDRALGASYLTGLWESVEKMR